MHESIEFLSWLTDDNFIYLGYREYRMRSFREVLQSHDVDGIWLDYHHSHASWEQAEPNLPDTCFDRLAYPRDLTCVGRWTRYG